MAGCSLIGGETAEMPDFYNSGEYDLAGFSVGVIEKAKIIRGLDIKEGDAVLGLSSDGLHSNGYSLARKLFFDIKKYKPNKTIKELGCTIGEELLKPTRIYVKSILKILKTFKVKAMAHITGGGITENIPRIFPVKSGLTAVIKKGSWPERKIFNIIQTLGKISDKEMFRTFNMGVGFVLIIRDSDASGVVKKLNLLGEKAVIIGRIEKGRGGVVYK
jgi:phosphoribosylformylglycinamidine cyclo-ligase